MTAIQKAREAAWIAIFAGDPAAKAATVATIDRDDLEIAIRAYLASATPADVGEEPVAALIAEGRKRSAVVDNYEGKNYLIRRLTDALERVVRDRDTLRARLETVEAETRERCAMMGYAICAESRHVSLGDKVAQAIRNLEPRHD